MNITVELENKEDFAEIKSLIEKIKGVKSVKTDEVELAGDGVPMWVYEELEKYSNDLKPEDLISEEDFLNHIKEERCRLRQVK